MQVLRTVIGAADAKNASVFLHFDKPSSQDIRQNSINLDLNKLMQNVGGEQFDYGTFKAAFDTDPRVKTMVANFNKKGIIPATQAEAPDLEDPVGDTTRPSNTVNQMAKRAVDLKDL